MPKISRRRFLQASVLAGAGTALGSVTAVTTDAVAATKPSDAAGAPPTPAVQAQAAAFHGPNQAALLSAPTPHTTLVSFDVVSADVAGVRDLLRVITGRARLLYHGGLPVDPGPAAPPDDNGILGPSVPGRQVAFVVALGASLFDDRYGLAPRRPVHLTTMPPFPNDNLDPSQLQLVLQNVLINAAQAMNGQGRVTVSVDTADGLLHPSQAMWLPVLRCSMSQAWSPEG